MDTHTLAWSMATNAGVVSEARRFRFQSRLTCVGSSFDNGGGPAPDGNAGCSFLCSGNSSEVCGGSNRLNMYEYINSDGTVSSTAPTSSSGTTSTGGNTSPAATPEPVTSGLPSGWQYSACYVDNTGARILPVQEPNNDTLTVEGCIGICSSAGYTVAGLEYSQRKPFLLPST